MVYSINYAVEHKSPEPCYKLDPIILFGESHGRLVHIIYRV